MDTVNVLKHAFTRPKHSWTHLITRSRIHTRLFSNQTLSALATTCTDLPSFFAFLLTFYATLHVLRNFYMLFRIKKVVHGTHSTPKPNQHNSKELPRSNVTRRTSQVQAFVISPCRSEQSFLCWRSATNLDARRLTRRFRPSCTEIGCRCSAVRPKQRPSRSSEDRCRRSEACQSRGRSPRRLILQRRAGSFWLLLPLGQHFDGTVATGRAWLLLSSVNTKLMIVYQREKGRPLHKQRWVRAKNDSQWHHVGRTKTILLIFVLWRHNKQTSCSYSAMGHIRQGILFYPNCISPPLNFFLSF